MIAVKGIFMEKGLCFGSMGVAGLLLLLFLLDVFAGVPFGGTIVVDVFGIWRWLGQETRWVEGAISAAEASDRAPVPKLFPAAIFAGGAVADSAGEHFGHSVDAMIQCDDGRVAWGSVLLRLEGIGLQRQRRLRSVLRFAICA